ncbi:hypothetical protein [Erythrobacter litoralis]|uniref:hypothetical protein n=1 Tax=Erythrobacter litoralis TaxID=39960 RepID=UPI0012DED8BF|nr:hypothetical protein [Erythrobacter litoralis]
MRHRTAAMRRRTGCSRASSRSVSRDAIHDLLHDPALALDLLGRAFHDALLLDILDRLRLHRFGGLVGHIRSLGFSDMHRAPCKQRTASSGCGQFRQGHLYRHGQTLLFLLGLSSHPAGPAWVYPRVALGTFAPLKRQSR